jgi:hypothetical protein
MANPKIEVEVGAKINEFERKFKDVEGQLESTGKQFNKLNEFAVGALQGIAAAFTVGAVVNFGKAVLDTTAKFQKFEAVLTNTLGSSSAAQLALIQISDFASQTPFAVDELTAAFVKLANQGFKPTTNELRSLGDLAASTGKSFDQLAEAIIDAQVGEFERLKEFGIRASKEGDNVKFTFKGVETQVKNTETAIRGYILSLGDAEGVSGAMAGISETLGGKISNLGDNIEQLKLAIGDQTSGVFAASLDWLNAFVEKATLAAKSVAQIREEASQQKIGTVIDANRKQVDELAQSYLKANPDLTKTQAFAKAIANISRGYRNALDNVEAFTNQSYTTAELKEIIEGFNSYAKELFNVSTNTNDATTSFEDFSKAYDVFNKKFLEGNPEVNTANFLLERQNQLAKELEETYTRLGKSISTFEPIDFNIAIPENAPQTDNAPELPIADKIKEALILLENELDERIPTIEERLRQFGSNIDDIIRNNVADAFIDLGVSIGEALANGENVLKAIGQSLLRSFSRFLGQLGEQLILFGTAGLAFGKLSLALTNPLTAIKAAPFAIAAGVALIAASTAIGSIGSKGIGSGGASVGTSGVGGGGESSFVGGGIGGFLNLDREIQLVSVVRGNDIVLVSERAMDRVNKG